MKEITGGVTAAKGFQAASTAAGIKYKDRKDMAMIYSEVPCKAAGTFTTNIVKAAPVKWDHNVVYNSKAAQAVVINAGSRKSIRHCSRRGVSCIYRSYWHAAPNRPYL